MSSKMNDSRSRFTSIFFVALLLILCALVASQVLNHNQQYDDTVHLQLHPSVLCNYGVTEYPTYRNGSEAIGASVFNVTLFNDFNVSKVVTINCTLFQKGSFGFFTCYGEKVVEVSPNASLSVEMPISNARTEGIWNDVPICPSLSY